LYCRQPSHHPTSVEHLGLDYKVEYINTNQGIMSEAHNIWVQYMESDENHLDNTFQGGIPSFPVLHFSWTLLNHILQFQESIPAGNVLSTFSKRCKKTQQWVICPQAQEYAVVIPTKFKYLHVWADSVDGFIRNVKQTNAMPNAWSVSHGSKCLVQFWVWFLPGTGLLQQVISPQKPGPLQLAQFTTKTHHFNLTTFTPLYYLSSDHIMTCSIRGLSRFTRSFICRILICNATIIH
jgi:hypothetical protein